MTNVDITRADVGPSFDRTPSEKKALSYVPQIKDAYEKALTNQRSGYKMVFDHAIACGELLNSAKEVVRGSWTEWRETHLPHIPQTTASLYMRLAKHKAELAKKEISNALLKLGEKGKLSIRSAVALLPKKQRRGPQPKKTAEGKHKDWLHDLPAADLVLVLKEIHGAGAADYLKELATALGDGIPPNLIRRPPLS